MQVPRANKDLLMLEPSIYLFMFFWSCWVVLNRSEPARSARVSFENYTSPSFTLIKWSYRIAWDRELVSFESVA